MTKGLTDKQDAFVKAYAKTGNASDAYRAAYDTDGMNSASINREASALLDHAKIAPLVAKYRDNSGGNSAPTIKSPSGAKINWPAAGVEWRKIEKLTPYARNARTHSAEQVAQIAASIKEWGWTMPVLIDEHDEIIAGHGRVMAAQQIAIADVPVLIARGWSKAKKQAYVLADNKLTLNGGWNQDFLRLELEELIGEGFAMPLLGFGESELDLIMKGWDSSFNPVDEDGENLDGIKKTIKVQVEQEVAERAVQAIKEALAAIDIRYELS